MVRNSELKFCCPFVNPLQSLPHRSHNFLHQTLMLNTLKTNLSLKHDTFNKVRGETQRDNSFGTKGSVQLIDTESDLISARTGPGKRRKHFVDTHLR